MSRAKNWCFTLNNYTDEEYQAVLDCGNNPRLVEYLVVGKEVGDNGTPHLQGYVVFNAAVRFTTVKNRLGSARLHLEVARGSPQTNKEYCTKDHDFEEFGTLPAVQQGRRTDLERFFEWAAEVGEEKGRPPTTPEAARAYPVILTKHSRIMQVARLRFDRGPLVNGELRQWQSNLDTQLALDAHPRKVRFIIDYEGGKGKSWFVRWYMTQFPETTQLFSVAKRDDIAHAVKENTRVFLFDIPRNQMEFLHQPILEQIKNRLVFSPKYTSMTKILMSTPHVVVFTNEDPDKTMTRDRYHVTYI